MSLPTKDQIAATILTVRAVADAIQSLKRVPSGELYARVMSHMDLPTYERIIETLKRIGLVTETAHVLEWRGPTLNEQKEQNSLL